jgi:dGTPase
LIQEAAAVFIDKEEQILKGAFHISLLEKCKYEAQINDIIKLSVEKIYRSKDVVEKEIAGYKIIADLLDTFITAINNKYNHSASNYDKLILLLIPDKYKEISDDLYTRILDVCNLVANFSDGNAILLHKKISGVDLV